MLACSLLSGGYCALNYSRIYCQTVGSTSNPCPFVGLENMHKVPPAEYKIMLYHKENGLGKAIVRD